MDSVLLAAFQDELEKIAISGNFIHDRVRSFATKAINSGNVAGAAERLAKTRTANIPKWGATVPGSREGINRSVFGRALSDGQEALRSARPANVIPLRRKTAAANPALVGAGLGSGLSALRGGMKEWDQRLDEEKFNLSDEQRKKLRNRRMKRMATGIGVGALAGGLTGHFGGKAVKAISSEAKSVADHSKKLLDNSIDRLGAHYKEPFTGENAERLGEHLKRGLIPNFLKRKKKA